jgi:molybdopterin synthase sulfur carrier subunit
MKEKKIHVLAFGRIADVLPRRMTIETAAEDTYGLNEHLAGQYPALRSQRYELAINRRIVRRAEPLPDGAEVALLPPFAGG